MDIVTYNATLLHLEEQKTALEAELAAAQFEVTCLDVGLLKAQQNRNHIERSLSAIKETINVLKERVPE